jgi:tetraacyldisaccharide 4'-kinase
LREPASALKRCDAVILTRADAAQKKQLPGASQRFIQGKPVFYAIHHPVLAAVVEPLGQWSGVRQPPPEYNWLEGRKTFAFAGIGHNSDFKRTLTAMGCHLKGFMGFSDHHPYAPGDVNALKHAYKQAGAEIMATTEKDMARLKLCNRWSIPLAVVGVDIAFSNQKAAFEHFVAQKLQKSE